MVSLSLFAQQNQEGNVRIIQDPAIEQLVERHVMVNQNRKEIPGFRIQIFFDSGTNSKPNAMRISQAFHQKFPETGIYLTFDSPNYKVRVGDFTDRLDAYRFMQLILPDYPNAYIVTDNIVFSLPN